MDIKQLSETDSVFLAYLRAISIFVIVFGHVGGFWFYRPYSEFLHVFVSIFFFISGAVSFYSFIHVKSVRTYYKKRLTSLLVPYYLMCILSLIVFLIINQEIPTLSIGSVLKWIEIRPSNDLMSFPLGQVWFLHTLFFIILASPLFFILRERSNNNYLLIIMCGIIVFSGVQLFFGIDHYFHSLVGNLYKPIIHSSFFIFGIISFTSDRFRSVKISTMLLIVCLTLSSFLVYIIDLNVDLAFHTYAPDLYYVLVSYSAIFAVLLAKPIIVYLVEFNVIIRHVFMFFHKHTFSIFLMHSFAIFLVEKIGGLVDPPDKTIEYGILKLSIVLIVTCFIAVPFTAISGAIVKKLIYIFTLKKV